MNRSLFNTIKFVLPVVILIGSLGVGIPMIKMQPDSYTATAKIWVQAQYPKSGIDSSAQNDTGLYLPFTSFFNDPIKTAGEIIRSDLVLGYAHDAAQKQLPKTRCPTKNSMRGSLKVDGIKDTDILTLSYANKDPKVAFIVLSGIVEGFMDLNSTQSSANAVKTRKFLQSEIHNLRQKMAINAEQIKQFALKHGTIDLTEDVKNKVARLDDLQSEIQSTRIAISKQRQLVFFLQSTKLPDAAIVSALQNDEIVQELNKKIAEIEVELTRLSTGLHETHPRVQRLRDSLESYRQSLDDRIALLKKEGVKKLDEPATVGHRQYLKLDSSVAGSTVQAQSELTGLESALIAQNAELKTRQDQLYGLPKSVQEYADLKRTEVLQSDQLLELEKRLSSAEMLESVAAAVTNIQIIDPPSLPRVPAGPNDSLVLLAVGILAVLLSVGTFVLFCFMDPAITKFNDVYAILEFPVIGAVPAAHDEQAASNKQAFDRIRLTLKQLLGIQDKMICVMSSSKDEGKTSIALGIAKALADSGSRVCLVDADDHDSSLSLRLKLQPQVTLQNYFKHAVTKQIQDNLLIDVYPNLWVIASEPSEDGTLDSCFEQASGKELIASLIANFDYVIFDTADTNKSTAALSLIAQGVWPLIIGRMQHTEKSAMRILSEQLRLQNIQRGIVVLSGTDKQPRAPLRQPEPAAGKKKEAASASEESDSEELWS